MEPRLSLCRDATANEWDEAAQTSSHATFFQTRIWANVWQGMEGFLPRALYCGFSDGEWLLWPFSEKSSRRGIVRERFLSAAGTYGGALHGPELTIRHMLAALPVLTRGHSLLWRLTPFGPHADSWARFLAARSHHPFSSWSVRADSTETLALESLPADGIHRYAQHSCRKQFLKGARAGLTARIATVEADWNGFAELYRRAVARWGDRATLSYPDRLFAAMQALPAECCRLWLAHHRERLVGGSLNFYHNRHAVEWLAAYDEEAFPLGVRNWLTVRMIEHAKASGFGVYDFNPSGSLEGTRRFKQTFNTFQMPAPLLARRTMILYFLERMGR